MVSIACIDRLVDVFPTLVSLVGLKPLEDFDGHGTDLAAVFGEPARGATFKNAAYTQCASRNYH